MKQRIQGMVAGFLVAVLLMGTVAIAAQETLTVTRSDMKLMIDGKAFTPTDSNGKTIQPFVHNGTTYLPLASVARAMGKTVEWDQAANTGYIGGRPSAAGETIKLSKLDYFTKDGGDFSYSEQARANTGDYFNDCFMQGIGWLGGGGTRDYLINGQYKKISGSLFLDYDTRAGHAIGKLNIWGDGKLLYSSDEIKAGFMPTLFEVDIINVTKLKIGFERIDYGHAGCTMGVSDVTLHK